MKTYTTVYIDIRQNSTQETVQLDYIPTPPNLLEIKEVVLLEGEGGYTSLDYAKISNTISSLSHLGIEYIHFHECDTFMHFISGCFSHKPGNICQFNEHKVCQDFFTILTNRREIK